MNRPTKTLVLWNPAAGSADKAQEIRRRLEQQEMLTLYESDSRDDAIDRVKSACREGVERLIVAGGDGTVSSVVEGMMESGEPSPILWILPLGTGNDFARSLGIDPHPDIAWEQWERSQPGTIDLVKFTSSQVTRWYANMLTGGNTGLYMDHLTPEIKQRWGPLCYLRGVVDVLKQLEVFKIRVELDDAPAFSCDALNVFFANGKNSGGGLPVSPNARVDDGLLDLVIVRDGHPQELASLTSEYLRSNFLSHDLIEYHQAKSMRVTSEPAMPLTADGDRVGETPLELKVHPQAISVLLPSTGK